MHSTKIQHNKTTPFYYLKHILYCLIVLICQNLKSNNNKDSLLNLLENETIDSIKIELLTELYKTDKSNNNIEYLKRIIRIDSLHNYKINGYKSFLQIAQHKLSRSKTDSVLYYLKIALNISNENNDSIGIAKTQLIYSSYYRFIGDANKMLLNLTSAKNIFNEKKDSINYFKTVNNEAYMNYRLGKLDLAQKLFNELIGNAEHPRDSWLIAASHLGLGIVQKDEGHINKSLNHNLEAYNIWKNLNDTVNYCKALNNIGIIYKDLSMYTLAIATFEEIINTNPSKDQYAVPLALANVASIHSNKNEFVEANNKIDLAIKKMKSIGNKYYLTVFNNIKSSVLLAEERYFDAEPYLKTSLKISKQHKYNVQYGDVLSLYAKFYFKTENYEKALKFAQMALEKAIINKNIKLQFDNNYLIGKILSKKGKSQLASKYLLKGLELNDTLKKEQENLNILESALTYEIGKKKAINESLKKEAELNNTIIEKTNSLVKLQRLYLFIIALFLLLSLFFLFIYIEDNKAKKRLNRELNLSNNEINDKNKKLNELLGIKSKIYSIISHDLKAPIISLHDSITMLKNADLNPDKKRRIFELTENQINATINLLNNILKWAEIHEKGIKVNLQKVNIYEIVNRNTNLSKLSAAKKELIIDNQLSNDIFAWCDDDLIDIVIRNILSNAIKFTPRKGTIKISAKSSNDKVIVNITDTGKGISQENIQKILNPDEYITTRGTENESGSGLGLKLCINYINYMQGKFAINSELNKGTNITIKIPGYTIY